MRTSTNIILELLFQDMDFFFLATAKIFVFTYQQVATTLFASNLLQNILGSWQATLSNMCYVFLDCDTKLNADSLQNCNSFHGFSWSFTKIDFIQHCVVK